MSQVIFNLFEVVFIHMPRSLKRASQSAHGCEQTWLPVHTFIEVPLGWFVLFSTCCVGCVARPPAKRMLLHVSSKPQVGSAVVGASLLDQYRAVMAEHSLNKVVTWKYIFHSLPLIHKDLTSD